MLSYFQVFHFSILINYAAVFKSNEPQE